MAADRGLAPETLALQLEQNYERLFGNKTKSCQDLVS